jgi:hypothetical protein
MFLVRWKQSALDRLAELWLEADNRSAISAAIEEIDRTLASAPASAGESRSDTTRVFFVSPVGVFFDVNEVDQIVSVLRVWSY